MCPESKKERRRTARVQHGDTCAGVAFSPLKIDNASLVDTLGYHFFSCYMLRRIPTDFMNGETIPKLVLIPVTPAYL